MYLSLDNPCGTSLCVMPAKSSRILVKSRRCTWLCAGFEFFVYLFMPLKKKERKKDFLHLNQRHKNSEDICYVINFT